MKREFTFYAADQNSRFTFYVSRVVCLGGHLP